MNASKAWYTSKAIWGTILMVLALALGVFGYTVSPEDQTQLADAIPNIIQAVSGFIGMVMMIWGRVTASKKLTLTKPK